MIVALYSSLGAHVGNIEVPTSHDDVRVILVNGAAFEFAYRERMSGVVRFSEVPHLVLEKAARQPN